MLEAAAWLDSRRPAPPAELRARMMAGLTKAETDGEAGDLPAQLAVAAFDRLEAVLRDPSTRVSAYDLLAADALLTYACEAAAEEGEEALQALLTRLSLEGFAALLHLAPE